MTHLLVMIAALLLDHVLGEAKRWHPLVGFGALAGWLEKKLNARPPLAYSLPPLPNPLPHGAREQEGEREQNITPSPLGGEGWGEGAKKIFFWSGLAAVSLLLLPLTALVYYLSTSLPHAWIFDLLILYMALGARSLADHGAQVAKALSAGDMKQARIFTGWLVSRDTGAMSETELSKATIESVLENGCDAVFAPLFWFLVGGAPAALFYRLANTLDAMWGYKTPRYLYFGKAAARLDDVLNFAPARLTALSYALAGKFACATSCWRAQAASWKSINAGPVMSSGAGALELQLGGPAPYHGQMQNRPPLGRGHAPTGSDIGKALSLLQRSILLWGAAALIFAGGIFYA